MGVNDLQKKRKIDSKRMVWAVFTSSAWSWFLAQMVVGIFGDVEYSVPLGILILGGLCLFPSRFLQAPSKPSVYQLIILAGFAIFLSSCAYFFACGVSYRQPLGLSLLGAWLISITVIVALFHYVRFRAIDKSNSLASFFSWPCSIGISGACLISMLLLGSFAYDNEWVRSFIYLLAVLCMSVLMFSHSYINRLLAKYSSKRFVKVSPRIFFKNKFL